MAQDMTITKVGAPRPYEFPPGNHLVGYRIELEGHGEAELSQKPETPAPTVGQSIFADLEPNKNPDFPPKVRKKQKDGGGWNGGGGGSKGVSPEQQRSIERQVAAKIAADLVIGGKVEFDQFRVALDRIHAAIQGEA